ncbi:hypothetical protein TL16_g08981 [Triparma laevis f. inornata]|uniref:Leucine-rich repeat domain-containing protein n=1 Tax=Triparma laevis f. inornata TaxID=1714386 RepID=A0A9W7B5Q7_9STRA|nr:hypothetical protein TL16_g08981 [Triparma laevis f. inornata]
MLERTAVACMVLSVAVIIKSDENTNKTITIKNKANLETQCAGTELSTEFADYGLDADHAAWAVLGIELLGFFCSLFFTPYWNTTEDFVDIIARAVCCVLAGFAAILMSCLIPSDTGWLIVTINASGATALFIMVFSIGPVRVTRNFHHYVQAQKRSRRFHIGHTAIKEMQENNLEGITATEFRSQSLEIQMLLVRQFPHYKPFVEWLQAQVNIELNELLVLEHCCFVMGQDLAWMYCTEHGSVNGVESEGGKVTRIIWAGAGFTGDVPSQISKLKKLKFVDLRFNALNGGDLVRVSCGIDSKSFLMDPDVEKTAVADCALAVGKDMKWLLEGAENEGKWPFRGVIVDAHGGKVTGINWSLSGLKGTLPLALERFKWLSEVNFSGNTMSEDLPMGLEALERRIGDKMKWGPAVTYLGTEKQFYMRADVVEVIVPDSFTEINLNAFRGCINMKKLSFGKASKLKIVKEGAFYDCQTLSEIKLPEGLDEIAESGFYNCGVTKIVIPKWCTEIGDRAFYGCRNLSEVKVPEGLKKIGKFAFADCPMLETIKLKKGTEIDDTSFAAVTNCEIIWYDDDNVFFKRASNGRMEEIEEEDFFSNSDLGNVV